MGMGMMSLKWKGFGAKNLFPHISSTGHDHCVVDQADHQP